MKSKFIWPVIVALSVGFIFLKERNLTKLQKENEALAQQLANAQAETEAALEAAKGKEAALAQREEEKAELIRLRGEVSSLRKEKEAWEKKLETDRTVAIAAAEARRRAAAQPAQPQTQGDQWVQTVVNGPSLVKGAETGNLRRKLLNGEPLNASEQALFQEMASRTKEIEQSPAEFASFQTAFVSSLLGWNNDPRANQVHDLLTKGSQAAMNRGFDYHAPAQNADKWDENQKRLNQRVTGGVQGLLTPEERAVFDKAFIGALGVDLGNGR